MSIKKNRLLQRFGRLVVVGETKSKSYPSGKKIRFLVCECDCGNKHITNINALRSGDCKSCGCLKLEGNNKRHGLRKTRFYRIWAGMKKRSGRYLYYEHVTFCKRWNKFENFRDDMYESYCNHIEKYGILNTSIDRKNNRLGYTKNNCRWATRKEQSMNRNRNYEKRAKV